MSTQLYRTLGKSGLKVSCLGLGTMNFGEKIWGCDEKTSIDIINNYLENGGNYIDTANIYADGESEKIIGKSLKNKRHNIIIATKCSIPMGKNINRRGSSRYNILAEVDDSLKRLRTDYIDLFYLHLYDPTTPLLESLSTLTDLAHSGKVRYLGVSNYTGWQISEMAGLFKNNKTLEPIIAVQNQYNLIFRTIEFEVIPACIYNNIGLVCNSPLASGVLAGVYTKTSGLKDERYTSGDSRTEYIKNFYINERNFKIYEQVSKIADELRINIATLSIAWLLNRPAVSSVLMGPRNLKHLNDYLTASNIEIPEEVMEKLDGISKPEITYHPGGHQMPDFFGDVEISIKN